MPVTGYLSKPIDARFKDGESTMTSAHLTAAKPFLIEQDYAAYSAEQHSVWAELVRRRWAQIEQWACREYLEGYDIIGLREDRCPHLNEIAERLEPRSGWRTQAVSGFMPHEAFFELLSARLFPTTTWLRDRKSLDYTPEPDMFHDVFGHVPMHAHRVFGNFVQHYAAVCARVEDHDILERLGRLYWFTVEFGLIKQAGKIKFYGSGVISSQSEGNHVIDGTCQVHDFNLDEVLDTPVKVDELQKVLFAIESFDQIYEAMQQAERKLIGSTVA
jgi:phenylalanine-4-hydroxylase